MDLVLLQQKFGNQPPAPPAAQAGAAGVAVMLLVVYGGLFVFSIIVFVLQILVLLAMSKCLDQCSRRNRQMEPGMVWLNLIPLFSLVWFILSILRVSDSLKDEYEDRNLEGDDDYGKTMGIITYVSQIIGCLCVAPIFQFLYWRKLGTYAEKLERTRSRSRRRDDEDEADEEEDDRASRRRPAAEEDDEDEDDRPSRRRRRRDDEDDDR